MIAISSPRVQLGEVLKKNNDWIAINPQTEYKQITVRLWGKGLVLRGAIAGANIAAATQMRVRTGQFLVSRIDARHGAFGLVPSSLDGAVTSSDFPSFTVDHNRLDPRFLEWMARTDWFVALCRAASEGSTNRVRLKEDRFLQQHIPLPPIAEQRKIVAQLDAAAERVEAHRDTASATSEQLNATLASAFRRITAGAPRATMGQVAPLVRREVTIEPDASYTEIGVRSFYKGIFHRRTMKGSEYTWQKLFRISTGDIVFSNLMAWEKAIALASKVDNMCVGNHRMLTCAPDPSISTGSFLHYYFRTDEGFSAIVDASPGSIARNKTLSPSLLAAIEVPLPSLDAQLWFGSIQERTEEARRRTAAAESELAALLPALLYRYLSLETPPLTQPSELVAAE